MARIKSIRGQDKYQIRVQGWISERWGNWFDGMIISYRSSTDDSPVTMLTGTVVDQAALRSLLTQIWDLDLISATRIKTSTE
ncbi:MAG: hypothetical protein GY832_40430 [Chloroflexi bacterium]|nr:hypothetical protein [Chloroflexota bacterium]